MEKEHYYVWVQTTIYKEKVDIDSILVCQAVNRKVDIYLHPEGKLEGTCNSLAHLEALLPGDKFYRCNRQCIINVERVDRYSEKIAEVVLANGMKIPIAKEKIQELKKKLEVE